MDKGRDTVKESHSTTPGPPVPLNEKPFHRALRRAAVWPSATLLAVLALLLAVLIYLFSTADRADHSNQVLAQISRIEKLAVDMETGMRGYRITGDAAFLEPFQRASAVFHVQLQALEKLLAADRIQLKELGELRESHRAWSDIATNLRGRVQAQAPADIAIHFQGKELMDAVRGHIGAMQEHERGLLSRRSLTRGRLRVAAVAAVALCALVAPLLALAIRRALLRVRSTYHDALGTAVGERERLSITLSSIGDAVVATDAHGRVTYLNPVATKLMGWSLSEALGQPLSSLFKIVHERSRKPIENPIETVLREGRVVGLANHTILIGKNGVETPIADSASPIRDAHGTIAGAVLVFRDQTAERQAAAKVEWLASFPERNPNPVMELSLESGDLVYANTFATKAFPDLYEKGMQHEFFAGLNEATKRLTEGSAEFLRREISVGQSCYAQTISYLAETKRLRVYCSDITETKSMEGALRHSRDQIRLISDGVPALISYVDSSRRYQFCNRAYEEWFGLPPEKLIGRTMAEVLGEEAWRTIGPHVEEALAGKNVEYEALARYSAGPRWIQAVYTPHRGEEGAVVGLVVMVMDVTQRKRAEMLLDSQKRALEMVVGGASLCEVLGYLAGVVEEQSHGKATASILLLDETQRLRNGASPSLPKDYLTAIDGLEPCSTIGTCCAAAATGKVVLTPDIDGDPKWQALKHLPLGLGFVAAWSQPITSSDGKVLGTFGTYFRERREPTAFERQTVEILARVAALAIERRRVEDERNRFVSLAENSSDFIGICDATFLPFFVNRAGLAMVGLENLEQARATPVKEFFFPEDQEQIINRFFPTVLAKGHGEIEIRFRHFKTGQALWMLYNVWVVTDAQGQFAGLATVSRDITDRKKAEEALRQSRGDLAAANEKLAWRAKELDDLVAERTAELRETIQQLETFSYSIVHDMRAPLRSMRSFAGFIEEDYGEQLDPGARDYLRRIMESSARMDTLITDVLNYSRVSRGGTDLSPVELDRLVPEIIEQYPHLQENIKFIHVERPLPTVIGNTALLTQVFSNLLGNAVKFVPKGRAPRVSVHAKKNSEGVRIWVEDNGIGVPTDQHERIFGLFQRLHRPSEYAGTGVGLAIVKKAVEKMGGKAGLESKPGEGSRFWIELRQ